MKGDDEEMILFEYGAESDNASQRAAIEHQLNRRKTVRLQNNIIWHEEAFQRLFHRILTDQCSFVLESKSRVNVTSSNYLEKETGLAYVRVHDDNTVTYSENDIVNNTQGDYSASIKNREKV